MGRSRREGRVGGLGRRRAVIADRPHSACLRRSSNATFRMQRCARPVCSGSRGPGAGSQLASVSEIRNRGSGGGRWANTRRPPQSLVLDSARGGAGPAATRPLAGVWWGEPRPPTHPGERRASLPAQGEAWPPALASRGGRGGGGGAGLPRRRLAGFFKIPSNVIVSTHWRTNSRKNWVGAQHHDRRM